MAFWIVIYILFLYLYICLKKSNITSNVVSILILVILVILTGIRYNVGADYALYSFWFYRDDFVDSRLEPLSLAMMVIPREVGFSSQMFFMLNGTLTLSFIYAGIQNFVKKNIEICFSLLIFTMNTSFWFFSMNAMRQFMAVAIVFWAAKFILSRNIYAYFGSVFFASLFHYSACIMGIAYFIPIFKMKKIYYVIGILCVLIISKNIDFSEVFNNLRELFDFYTYYTVTSTLERNENFFSWQKELFFFSQFIFILCMLDINNYRERFFINMIWVDSILRFLLMGVSFTDRIKLYFGIFSIIALVLAIRKLKYSFEISVIVLFVFSCAAMVTYYHCIYYQAGLADFDYNLKFLK